VGLVFGLLIPYALGSIPFGYLIPYALKRIDIREHGSGNMGAANVYRILGPWPGLAVGVMDLSKGWFGVALVCAMQPGLPAWGRIAAGLAAIAGHNWPVWLKFRGGKGMLTSAGVFLYLAWLPMLGAVAVFALTFTVTGYVSIGSLCSAVALPMLVLFLPGVWNEPVMQTAALAAGVMAFFRHRSNIRSLFTGTERRFHIFGRRP